MPSPTGKRATVTTEYMKRAATIIGGAARDYFSEAMPIVSSVATTSQSAIQDFRSTYKQSDIIPKVRDLKRQLSLRQISDWFLGESNKFDDGGFEDIAFDVDVSGDDTDSNMSSIAEAQIASDMKSANQISKTVVETSYKMVEAQISATANILASVDRLGGTVASGFDSVNQSLNKILEVLTKNTSTLITVTGGLAAKEDPKDKLRSSRLFNAQAYMDMVKGNMGDESGMLSMLPMLGEFGKDSGLVGSMLLGSLTNKMLPNLQANLKVLDETFSDTMMRSLVKLGDKSNIFGRVLGIHEADTTLRTKPSQLKLKEMGYNSYANEAITRTIPGYLKKILIQLGGKDEQYDFNSRTFKSEAEITQEVRASTVSRVDTGMMSKSFQDKLGGFNIYDNADFAETMQTLLIEKLRSAGSESEKSDILSALTSGDTKKIVQVFKNHKGVSDYLNKNAKDLSTFSSRMTDLTDTDLTDIKHMGILYGQEVSVKQRQMRQSLEGRNLTFDDYQNTEEARLGEIVNQGSRYRSGLSDTGKQGTASGKSIFSSIVSGTPEDVAASLNKILFDKDKSIMGKVDTLIFGEGGFNNIKDKAKSSVGNWVSKVVGNFLGKGENDSKRNKIINASVGAMIGGGLIGGPLGLIMGGLIGNSLSATDHIGTKIKRFLFGEDEVDEEGNKTGKKKQGLLARTLTKITDPIKFGFAKVKNFFDLDAEEGIGSFSDWKNNKNASKVTDRKTKQETIFENIKDANNNMDSNIKKMTEQYQEMLDKGIYIREKSSGKSSENEDSVSALSLMTTISSPDGVDEDEVQDMLDIMPKGNIWDRAKRFLGKAKRKARKGEDGVGEKKQGFLSKIFGGVSNLFSTKMIPVLLGALTLFSKDFRSMALGLVSKFGEGIGNVASWIKNGGNEKNAINNAMTAPLDIQTDSPLGYIAPEGMKHAAKDAAGDSITNYSANNARNQLVLHSTKIGAFNTAFGKNLKTLDTGKLGLNLGVSMAVGGIGGMLGSGLGKAIGKKMGLGEEAVEMAGRLGKAVGQVTGTVGALSNSGLAGKAKQALVKAIEAAAKGIATKWPAAGEFVNTFVLGLKTTITTKITEGIESLLVKKFSEETAKAAAGTITAGIGFAALGAAGAIAGACNVDRLFGILPNKADRLMKTIATAFGTIFAAVPYVGLIEVADIIAIPLFGIGVRAYLARGLYGILKGDNTLSQLQGELTEAVAKYNEQYGTKLDDATYNDMTNRGAMSKLWSGKTVTDASGNVVFDESGKVTTTGGIKGFFSGSKSVTAPSPIPITTGYNPEAVGGPENEEPEPQISDISKTDSIMSRSSSLFETSPLDRPYKINSKFGPRNVGGNASTFHKGIDLGPLDGHHPTNIAAIGPGTVEQVQDKAPDHNMGVHYKGPYSMGNFVNYRLDNGMLVRNLHLAPNSIPGLKRGDRLEAGQRIGTMGSTGVSSGKHLHFDIARPGNDNDRFDPLPLLEGKPYNADIQGSYISGYSSGSSLNLMDGINEGDGILAKGMKLIGNAAKAISRKFKELFGMELDDTSEYDVTEYTADSRQGAISFAPLDSFDTDYTDWSEYNNVSGSQKAFILSVAPAVQGTMGSCKVLASVRLAQAILESGWGTSTLAVKYNNLFGMTKGSWTGPTSSDGKWRAYSSRTESIQDQANNFSAPRYADMRDERDWRKCVEALGKSGYCADPGYDVQIAKIIDQYKLYFFDHPKRNYSTISETDLYQVPAFTSGGELNSFAAALDPTIAGNRSNQSQVAFRSDEDPEDVFDEWGNRIPQSGKGGVGGPKESKSSYRSNRYTSGGRGRSSSNTKGRGGPSKITSGRMYGIGGPEEEYFNEESYSSDNSRYIRAETDLKSLEITLGYVLNELRAINGNTSVANDYLEGINSKEMPFTGEGAKQLTNTIKRNQPRRSKPTPYNPGNITSVLSIVKPR